MDQGRSYSLSGANSNIVFPDKKRIVVGSSNSADIRISGLADIHCLIEITSTGCKAFSFSPDNPVKVNGTSGVALDVKAGDTIELAGKEFTFGESQKKILPKVAPVFSKAEQANFSQSNESVKYDRNYPLNVDPKSQFSEYIYEDENEVYPIFKYNLDKKAAEVIILFKGNIVSVDYIPQVEGTYSLSGVPKKSSDIEFPYLGKEERFPLIDIIGSEIQLTKVPGFEYHSFSDSKGGENLFLNKDDIHIFEHEHLKIFVRGAEAPPFVRSAPVFRRDKEFKKYLILCLLFVTGFISLISLYEVDPEMEKDKAPERIATILYKPKKLRVTKKNDPLTKKRKTKVKQKADVKKIVKKSNSKKKNTASKGNISAKGKGGAKKGIAKVGKPNRKKVVRAKTKKVGKSGKTSSKTSTVRNRTPIAKNKGRVDTYKSVDFKSSLSSLMSKGGTLSSFKNNSGASESFKKSDSALSSDDSARVQRSDLDSKVGSLTDATRGKLSSSFGTEGLVQKKQVYIAGVPYREVILGSIDRNDIMRILLENVPQFRYCYQRELEARQQGIDGVLSLNFVIGPSGHVTRARVVKSDKSLPSNVKSCVVSHLKTIIFPKPKGGGEVSVNTPLNLHSKSM